MSPPQTETAAAPELSEEQKQAEQQALAEQQAQAARKAEQEAAAKAQTEQHARVVAEHQAGQKAAAARTRYAQIVDAIRTGATAEELEQASDALKPIAQAVSGRM